MTIFLSQRPNLDPMPWAHPNGFRREKRFSALDRYDPRPEFEPTRDPLPWYSTESGTRYKTPPYPHPTWIWEPRRDEYDTPVNRVLAALRQNAMECQSLIEAVEMFLGDADSGEPETVWAEATPAAIEHARRVLSRLANIRIPA